MSPSIAVLGAGPGLGRSVARRYARAGYAVALVARRPEPLDRLAAELADDGARAHAIPADLADTEAVPALVERIRAAVGEPDVVYLGVAPEGAFVPVLDLTPEHVRDLLPLLVGTPLALVRELLPAMLARGSGAILSAQGASAVRGVPTIAGGLLLAGLRNYLQALRAAVGGQGVHVGELYIGAAIENTPFYAAMQAAEAAGEPVPDIPVVDPAHLADLLWEVHATGRPEARFPDDVPG